MNTERIVNLARWTWALAGVGALTVIYDRYLHVNATTVALSYLLFILFLSTRWGLRFAIGSSVMATGCYNYFFLPPVHTFTVSDPQNLVALLVFLTTSVWASRMAERVREESQRTLVRQGELEVLYGLSRALLETDELAVLTNTVPSAIAAACRADGVMFYLLQGDRLYQEGAAWPTQMGPVELRALANASAASINRDREESVVPIRTGVRPRGVLLLRGVQLSVATLEAMGGLISVALDRARAVDEATRAEGAKESERLRTMMMDSITHEFRSPLTAIKVSVSTLRTTALGEGGQQELLAIIEEEADRLDGLVAQSVEMARLDTLDVTMSFAPETMKDLVGRAVATAGVATAQHKVEVSLATDLPRVEADAEWLTKLLVNLLENAAKYSQAGSPIFVMAERRGEMVACSVADRGIGIDLLEQELIFDKFYRSRERTANVSGTGMGLAICRAIAEAHGGTMEVTSQPGQGSVFTFTVPVAE